jgi:hypothetical protein
VRFRVLGAAAAAVLAVAGLAGCHANVGTAAWVDGQRISDSDVSQYITPQSQPVTGQNGSISPRSFVLAELINERLGFKILQAIPSVSSVTSQQLDAQLQKDLAGKSVKSAAEGLGLKGYTTDFYQIVLRVQEIARVVSSQQQSGADLQKIFKDIHFPVTVGPRYGTWDKKNLTLNGTIPIPNYLSVAPGGPAS